MRRLIMPLDVFLKEENGIFFFGNYDDREIIHWTEISQILYDELIKTDKFKEPEIYED
jgi:hypothetical protein